MLLDLLRLNKKIVIYGKGRSGKAIHKYLKLYDINSFLVDDADGSSEDWFKQNPVADVLIVSPGVAPDKISHLPYSVLVGTLDLELLLTEGFFKIGVTGSAGKSTTCNLLGHLLERSFVGGNFGNSFLDIPNSSEISCLIVEASSYQLEYHKYSFFDCGVITSIFPNHLKRHKTLENYLQAKLNLVRHIKGRGFLVCRKDFQEFDLFLDCAKKKDVEVVTVSQQDPNADVFSGSSSIQLNFLATSVNFNELDQLDPNSKTQLALALPVAVKMGLDLKTALEKIRLYKPLPHRFETISVDPLIINDSKSTSLTSLVFSARKLSSLVKNFNLICGGRLKEGEDLELLRKLFIDLQDCIQLCICFGESRKQFSLIAESAGIKTVLVEKLSNLDKAFLKHNTLFSPGAESFDEFCDYEERGAFFKEIVRDTYKLN